MDKERQLDIDRGIRPLTARGANLVDITCAKKADIVLKCDADAWEDRDHLEAHTDQRSETQMRVEIITAQMEFCSSVNCEWRSSPLRLIVTMHCTLCSPMAYWFLTILLFFREAKRQVQAAFADFTEYAERERRQPPNCYTPELVFSAHREKSSDAYMKAGASELIAVGA